MKQIKTQVNPLEGSIIRGMTLFALPIMATGFLQVLFSSVDTMVIGKYGSENGMAAIGASATLIHLIISAVTALSTGISITIGYHYGKRDFSGIGKILQSLPLTGLIMGLVVSVLANVLWVPLLQLVKCPDTLMGQAGIYFRIYFLSTPFMLIFSFMSAVIQAKGVSTKPFVIQILCSLLNLVLNLIFVIYFRWDVAGVAIATVISQILSAVLIIFQFLLLEKDTPLLIQGLTAFKGLGGVFKLGIPSSLEGIAMNISGVVIQSAINGFPEYVISGNTAAASVEGMMSVAFIGFSAGCVVFISQNRGNKNWERVKKVQRCSTLIVFTLGEILGVLIYALSPYLLKLYTDDAAIAEIAQTRMIFMCLFFGLCGTMNSLSGSVRGLGDAKTPLIISLVTSCGFRILWILTVAKWIASVSAIYISYPLCWLMTTGLYLIAFQRALKKNQD